MVLRTVAVNLVSGNKRVRVNALLDYCSTSTYINGDVAAHLGLEGTPDHLDVHVLDGGTSSLDSSIVSFTVESTDGRIRKQSSAHTTNRVTGEMEVINWNKHRDKWPHLQNIKFPSCGLRPIVDILIGADHCDLLLSQDEVVGASGEPIARLTPLGWTCIGHIPGMNHQRHTHYTYFENNVELCTLVHKFWDIEEPNSPIDMVINPDNKAAQHIAEKSLTYEDGRYSVGIPWKSDGTNLPDNMDMAFKRLENTEKRLLKSPEAYQNIIVTYQDKEYIRKVSQEDPTRHSGWFLPHFPVLRPDKSTTKTRIVFDASAKYEGISLNDVIHQVPKLQNNLVDILTRFRREPVGLMCDISEMYLQIRLSANDRPYHRFLWRNLDQNKPPDIFEFNRVVFGVNSSPFMAQYVAQHHARQFQNQYPKATEIILRSTYMENSMDSFPDEATCIQVYRELSELWELAGMHPHKWLSNSSEVLKVIPQGDCVSNVDLDKGNIPLVKTLGVIWDPKIDQFKYSINPPDPNITITKRNFLSKIATLFDPLGFLMPYTVRAKILIQDMWSAGYGWDEPVGPELTQKAMCWFNELSDLENVHM